MKVVDDYWFKKKNQNMVQISIYFYFLDYFPGTVAIKHLPGNLSETE